MLAISISEPQKDPGNCAHVFLECLHFGLLESNKALQDVSWLLADINALCLSVN